MSESSQEQVEQMAEKLFKASEEGMYKTHRRTWEDSYDLQRDHFKEEAKYVLRLLADERKRALEQAATLVEEEAPATGWVRSVAAAIRKLKGDV